MINVFFGQNEIDLLILDNVADLLFLDLEICEFLPEKLSLSKDFSHESSKF